MYIIRQKLDFAERNGGFSENDHANGSLIGKSTVLNRVGFAELDGGLESVCALDYTSCGPAVTYVPL